MKYMKNHFAGILSVILAVVSLSGSSMPVVSANSAERIAKKETIVKLDEKLGAEPGKVLEELKNHEKDGYYLGTPYSGYPLTAENCMRPNGAYGGNGAMNCTGFVAYVLEKCGADLSEIDKGSLRGGKVNASNWFHWMTDNAVESYHYNTIEELLMSAEYIMAAGNERVIRFPGRKKMQTAISDFSGEIIATITGSGIRHLSRRVVIRFHSLWQNPDQRYIFLRQPITEAWRS